MQEYSSKQYDDQEYEGHVKLNITMSHQVLRHNDNWYSPICMSIINNQHDNQKYEGNGKLNIMMSHQVLRHDDYWYSPIYRNILQNGGITSHSWESFHLEARVWKLVSNAREIKSTAVLEFPCLSKYWDKANIYIPLWTKNSITPLIRLRCGSYCFRV